MNSLVNRFFEARKMMQSLAGGMPGMPGVRRPAAKQQAKKKKGNHKVSGNPAKRSGGPAAAPEPTAAPASAFGADAVRGRPRQGCGRLPVAAGAATAVQPEEHRSSLGSRPWATTTHRPGWGSRSSSPTTHSSGVPVGPPEAQRLHLSGVVLPGGDRTDLWMVDGLVRTEPVADAVTVCSDAWIMPGLVDAHCHVGLGAQGAVSSEVALAQATADRDAGTLLIRDAGSPVDTHWIDDRPDLPRIIRAGRHIARPKRYIRNYAEEVEPEALVEEVARQASPRRRVGEARRRLDRP